jgi:shikimate dehydrogenase
MPAQKNNIAATTRYVAVYGHPVKHSASPAMHNAALAHMGLDWRYLAFDVHPEHLSEAIAGARRMKFVGLNLTVPHKLLAIDLVDELDSSAKDWGAVNTILIEARCGSEDWKPIRLCDSGKIIETRSRGFNTDAYGLVRAIEEDLGLTIRGRTILLLGAGGAGRAAALKFAAEGAKKLYLVNRTRDKAEEVAREIRKRCPEVEVDLGCPDASTLVDLVLNATSLGLNAADPLPFARSEFSLNRAGAAYDMIYRPAETPFLAEAARVGVKTANGLGMLLYQGAKALEIWSGESAPVEVMRAALKEQIYGKV